MPSTNRPLASATIVFDLDGTLVDTAPDLVETLNVVLRQEGLAPLRFEDARLLVGGGAKMMLKRGLECEGIVARPDLVERLFGDFIAYYSAHIADKSRPFPGLLAALDRLSANGCRFAVCTNKLEALSVQLLGALGIRSRFAAICGQDTFGVQKPDPEVLRKTIAAAGGEPTRAVLIGDSQTDILTARAAAVPIIAVTFGYSDPPVATFSPDRLIDHFDQLEGAVSAVLGTA